MSQFEPSPFNYVYGVDVPASALARLWDRWSAISSWHEWDASLEKTEASGNGLALGKKFAVAPRMAPGPVPVTVLAFAEGVHFTTCSSGPMGMLAFGHTLIPASSAKSARLEHSICALPADAAVFGERIWPRLQDDVRKSVERLAELVMQRVPA